jgi:hypothetical protein
VSPKGLGERQLTETGATFRLPEKRLGGSDGTFQKPFFRAPRGLRYVWHGGRQVNLGPDQNAAFTAFHALKAKPEPKPVTAAEAAKLVAVVIDDFLDYVEHRRSPRTYRWHKDRPQLFLDTIPADFPLDQLKPFHIQKWIDAYLYSLAASLQHLNPDLQQVMDRQAGDQQNQKLWADADYAQARAQNVKDCCPRRNVGWV